MPLKSRQLTLNGIAFCLNVEQDAAAEDYYNSFDYATKVGGAYAVFEFIVHSVNCLNYPQPATQCAAFDETRDTADFQGIAATYRLH